MQIERYFYSFSECLTFFNFRCPNMCMNWNKDTIEQNLWGDHLMIKVRDYAYCSFKIFHLKKEVFKSSFKYSYELDPLDITACINLFTE